MNLFVQTGYATNAENMNLTLYGDNFSTTASSGSMHLTTVNSTGITIGTASSTIVYNNENNTIQL